MFDFKPFFDEYVFNIIVNTPEEEDTAWDNMRQVEDWASNELEKIQGHYDFLSKLVYLGARVYIELVEPPPEYNFADEWLNAQ